jgi:hypothetical protein
MTTVAFEQCLSQNKSRFAQIDAQPTATIHPNAPVDDRHINAAEMRLGGRAAVLVHNVGGSGNFVAMNPREQTASGEGALYYCSHDPFGFGEIADSFESWTREAVTAFEENDDLYGKAADDVEQTWRSFRAKTKKWWQFWR